MFKRDAKAVEAEMADKGFAPLIALVQRQNRPQTWETWGTDPATGKGVVVASLTEWEQYKEAQPTTKRAVRPCDPEWDAQQQQEAKG